MLTGAVKSNWWVQEDQKRYKGDSANVPVEELLLHLDSANSTHSSVKRQPRFYNEAGIPYHSDSETLHRRHTDRYVEETLLLTQFPANSDMPKDRVVENNDDHLHMEDVEYGPGIVKKLREKFLQLAAKDNDISHASATISRRTQSVDDLLDACKPKHGSIAVASRGNNQLTSKAFSQSHGALNDVATAALRGDSVASIQLHHARPVQLVGVDEPRPLRDPEQNYGGRRETLASVRSLAQKFEPHVDALPDVLRNGTLHAKSAAPSMDNEESAGLLGTNPVAKQVRTMSKPTTLDILPSDTHVPEFVSVSQKLKPVNKLKRSSLVKYDRYTCDNVLITGAAVNGTSATAPEANGNALSPADDIPDLRNELDYSSLPSELPHASESIVHHVDMNGNVSSCDNDLVDSSPMSFRQARDTFSRASTSTVGPNMHVIADKSDASVVHSHTSPSKRVSLSSQHWMKKRRRGDDDPSSGEESPEQQVLTAQNGNPEASEISQAHELEPIAIPPPPHVTHAHLLHQGVPLDYVELTHQHQREAEEKAAAESEAAADIDAALLREHSTTVAKYEPVTVLPVENGFHATDVDAALDAWVSESRERLARNGIATGDSSDEEAGDGDDQNNSFAFEFIGHNVIIDSGNLSKGLKEAKSMVAFADEQPKAYAYLHEDELLSADSWEPGVELVMQDYIVLREQVKQDLELRRLKQAAALLEVRDSNLAAQGGLAHYMPSALQEADYELGVTNRWVYDEPAAAATPDATATVGRPSANQTTSRQTETAENWSMHDTDLLF